MSDCEVTVEKLEAKQLNLGKSNQSTCSIKVIITNNMTNNNSYE